MAYGKLEFLKIWERNYKNIKENYITYFYNNIQ